jgi:hypothetical protein
MMQMQLGLLHFSVAGLLSSVFLDMSGLATLKDSFFQNQSLSMNDGDVAELKSEERESQACHSLWPIAVHYINTLIKTIKWKNETTLACMQTHQMMLQPCCACGWRNRCALTASALLNQTAQVPTTAHGLLQVLTAQFHHGGRYSFKSCSDQVLPHTYG